jgi:hypothetical protein
LADFLKPGTFDATLDFAKSEGLKPPQPLPRFGGQPGVSCDGRFEVQLERLAKIGKSLLFSVALAGNIHIQALGNKPIALAPNGSRKWVPILVHHE